VKLGDVARVIYARLRPQVLLFIHALSCHNRWREVNIPLELSCRADPEHHSTLFQLCAKVIEGPSADSFNDLII
jgi:hypothetical protein